jgi:hypothetical protein
VLGGWVLGEARESITSMGVWGRGEGGGPELGEQTTTLPDWLCAVASG